MKHDRRVLLVEDEDELRNTLLFLLYSHGYSVTAVRNGAEGLACVAESAKDVPYGLIITDLKMPVMSGQEMIELIHQKGITVPIIVITGHGNREVMNALTALGCVAGLPKPFDPDKVLCLVGQYFAA